MPLAPVPLAPGPRYPAPMAGSPDEAALFVPMSAVGPRPPEVVGRYLPTELARGPWDPTALHGGPVAALLAGAAESLAPGPERPASEMAVTRLSVELLRPVPLEPLELTAQLVRPGRKVQLVDCALRTENQLVAMGRALRLLRRAPTAGGEGAPGDARLPGPEVGVPAAIATASYRGFHSEGAELRFVEGSFEEPGPATAWVRLTVPVVAGQPTSPVQRAAAAADFGNGISAVLPFDRWRFINPDLTVTLERPPEGQWVALRARTSLGVPGIGVARGELLDSQGAFGSSFQCLVVEPRTPRP